MGDDDFLFPSDRDNDDPCAVNIERGAALKVVLPFFASLSIVCYSYLLWMYFIVKSPVFMRHPTTLAIYKCIFELLLVQQYLWAPVVHTRDFYDDDHDEPPYSCHSSSATAYMAFISQTALVGAELCFLVISLDLHSAYTNPFSSYKQNRLYYAAAVLSISISTGLILLFMGPKIYGLSNLGLVWIQNRRSKHSFPYPKFVLYYDFVAYVFSYSLWANLRYTRDSYRGLSKAVSNRLTIMRRSRDFTLAFIGYGCLLFGIEIVAFILHDDGQSSLGWIPPFLQSFRGVFSLIVILYSNRQDLSFDVLHPYPRSMSDAVVEDVAVERLMLEPHLNTTLRAEILYFTTQGIMFASREFQELERVRSVSHDRVASINAALRERLAQEAAQQEEEQQKEHGSAIDLEADRMYSFDNGSIRPSIDQGVSFPRISNANRPAQLSSEALQAAEASRSKEIQQKLENVNKEQDLAVSRMLRAAVEDEIHDLGCYHNELRPYNKGKPRHGIHSTRETSASDVGNSMSRDPTLVMGTNQPPPVRNPLMSVRNRFSSPEGDGFEMQSSYSQSISRERLGSSSNGGKEQIDKETGAAVEGTDGYERSTDSYVQDIRLMNNSKMVRDSENLEFGIQSNQENFTHGRAPRFRRISRRNTNPHARNVSVDSLTRLFRSIKNTASKTAKSLISAEHNEFRFKDHCPKLFARMRQLCGIDNNKYARTFETTCKEKFSEGRSGAFMFYSGDEQFIVKTTTRSESRALQRAVPRFVKYFEENPNSLVVRFLGSHRITMYGVRLYFVVMLNVFPTFPLSERYDLKGSWVNRHGFSGSRRTRKQRMNMEEKSFAPLFLDNDLQHKISLDPEVAEALARQIRCDIIFLRDINIMDYSLLIGVSRERYKVLNSDDMVSLHRLTSATRDSSDERVVMPICTLERRVEGNGDDVETERKKNSAHNSRVSDVPDRTSGFAPAVADRHSDLSTISTTRRFYWRMNSNTGEGDSFNRDAAGGMRAHLVEGPGTYYMGIIDVLQEWNWQKYFERQLKVYIKFVDPDGLSALSPYPYAERFWRRCVLDAFDGLPDEETDLMEWGAVEDDKSGHDVDPSKSSIRSRTPPPISNPSVTLPASADIESNIT